VWARRFLYYSVNSVFFILYYLVLLHFLAIFPYFWPSRRYAMSTRFPFVPRLATFRAFPYYSLKTRFSFFVVFLRCSYSRTILGVQFSSPNFLLFPLLQMVWRTWILARHLSFLLQPVNRVLYTPVIVSKFYLCRRLSMSYDKPRKSRAKAHIANGTGTRVLENIPLKSTGNVLREYLQ